MAVCYRLTKRKAKGVEPEWIASFRTYGMAWDCAQHMFNQLSATVVGCHMDQNTVHCGEFFVIVDRQTEVYDIHEVAIKDCE